MTLPNKITISRILIIPVFLILMFNSSMICYYASVILFTLLALTDSVDGYIARKYNQISDLGKILDPLADKLLVISAMVGLVELRQMAAWMAIIIIARELIVTSLRIVAANKEIVIGADIWGKVKTVMQIIAVIAMLTNRNISFNILGIPFSSVSCWLTLFAVIATIASGIEYVAGYRFLFKKQ